MNAYIPILGIFALASLFIIVSINLSGHVGPQRYNRAKYDSYECGIQPTPQPVGGGRFPTDRDGYDQMRRYAGQWPDRIWAIEGCAGIGKHIAVRLLSDGEEVVDVPPKLSARARVFASGQGRKTDATDAHSVALIGTRMAGLRPVVNDEQLAVLRLLVDRRRSLGEEHTRKTSQLHQLLL